MVYFDDNDDPEELMERDSIKKTHLTEWFTANRNLEGAKNVSYQDFPQAFTWNKKTKKWNTRRQCDVIGRMYFVHPSAGERFYLRMLLTTVKGPESWEHLRTFDGGVHPNYKEACLAHSLLEDDGEWKQCLQEAGNMLTGHQLRNLFAIILIWCKPLRPHTLWEHYKVKMCDDLHHRLIAQGRLHPTEEDVFDYGLHLLENILIKSGKRLLNFDPMPIPQQQWEVLEGNFLLQEQLDYDPEEMRRRTDLWYPQANDEQRATFDKVMDSVNNNEGKMFFLHSAGGCGKTYLCNAIAAAVRADSKVALCVASSAIAALLLHGGRTAHSRLKIPIPIDEASNCNIAMNSDVHAVLKETKVIIWDEAPMQHRHGPEAIDRTIHDLFQNDKPTFGGITMLFVGDFRQTLPVVPRGSRAQIVNASLRRSMLWRDIEVCHLTKNMRLDRTPESEAFAEWLLKVGSGSNLTPEKTIELFPEMRLPQNDIQGLVNAIYPDIDQGNKPDAYFLERTILSSKNDTVNRINQMVLDRFPGEETVVISADKVNGHNSDTYPTEFLNSLTISGFPLAHLPLKPGCPLMLLRNIDPINGLCNGTRMVLLEIRPRVLKCRILGGDHAGKEVFIPRITLDPSEDNLPIDITRRQFPVRLAFAMTINKSQGQSIMNVGIDLRTPVFAHGQLYVALSRCTSKDRIKVLFPELSDTTHTTNIVYPEVIAGLINH